MPFILNECFSEIEINEIDALTTISNQLKTIFPDCNGDPLHTHLISDMISKLAGQQEYLDCFAYSFKRENMSIYYNGLRSNRFLLLYNLDENAAYQILENLKRELGTDKVALILSSDGTNYNCFFEIDYQTLVVNILSKAGNFLNENPDRKNVYQLNFKNVFNRYNSLIENYGISPNDTDIFEHTLCRMVWNHYKTQQITAFHDSLPSFHDDLNTIIKKYVWDYQPNEEEKRDNTFNFYFSTKSHFGSCRYEAWISMDLNLLPNYAASFVNYFNNILPDSAVLLPQINKIIDMNNEEKLVENTEGSRIVLSNKLLSNKQFYDKFCNVIAFLPLSELDKYRSQSKYLTSHIEKIFEKLDSLSEELSESYNEMKEDKNPLNKTFIEDMASLMKAIESDEEKEQEQSPVIPWQPMIECFNTAKSKFVTLTYLEPALKAYYDKFLDLEKEFNKLNVQATNKTAIEIENENDSVVRLTR